MRIIFFAAVGLSLAIGSTAALASAQPAATVHHVGVLGLPAESSLMAAFRQGLQDRGYSEGRNIRFTYRGRVTDRDADAAALAIELVRLKVDVIVAIVAYRRPRRQGSNRNHANRLRCG